MFPAVGTSIFCKNSDKYDAYGVKKVESKKTEYFAAASDSRATVTAQQQYFVEAVAPSSISVADEIQQNQDINNVIASSPSSAAIEVQPQHHETAAAIGKVQQQTVQTVQQTNETQQVSKFAKILLKLSTAEMVLENFIGSIWTVYHEGCTPLAARILVAPIALGVGSVVYTQVIYTVQSAERAIKGAATDEKISAIATCTHQLQAAAGLLASVLEGLKFYFTVLIVSNDNTLSKTLAVTAGIERFVAFLGTKGHASTPIQFGKTAVGKFWYGFLASPITPNFISFAESTMPLVGFVLHTQAILVVSEMLEKKLDLENNGLVKVVTVVIAGLSGMLEGLMVQRGFSCDKLLKYFEENRDVYESSKVTWYGDEHDVNTAQQTARVIRSLIKALFIVPLALLHVVEQMLHFLTLLTMSVLPVQILSVLAYISRAAIVYRVFYVAAQCSPDMIQLYTGKDINGQLDENQQLLVAIAGVPLGLAMGYAVLMSSGASALKITDKVYGQNGCNTCLILNNEHPLIEKLSSATNNNIVINDLDMDILQELQVEKKVLVPVNDELWLVQFTGTDLLAWKCTDSKKGMKYLNFPKSSTNSGVIYLSERVDEQELKRLFHNYAGSSSPPQLNINTSSESQVLIPGTEDERANTTLTSRLKSVINFGRQHSLRKIWSEIKKLWAD